MDTGLALSEAKTAAELAAQNANKKEIGFTSVLPAAKAHALQCKRNHASGCRMWDTLLQTQKQ
jgi:hypothetical protein